MGILAGAKLGDDVGILPAAGTERAGGARHQHFGAAERLGDGQDIEPGSAAAGNQNALRRINAVLHGDFLNRFDHLLTGDGDDGKGRLLSAHFALIGNR